MMFVRMAFSIVWKGRVVGCKPSKECLSGGRDGQWAGHLLLDQILGVAHSSSLLLFFGRVYLKKLSRCPVNLRVKISIATAIPETFTTCE